MACIGSSITFKTDCEANRDAGNRSLKRGDAEVAELVAPDPFSALSAPLRFEKSPLGQPSWLKLRDGGWLSPATIV